MNGTELLVVICVLVFLGILATAGLLRLFLLSSQLQDTGRDFRDLLARQEETFRSELGRLENDLRQENFQGRQEVTQNVQAGLRQSAETTQVALRAQSEALGAWKASTDHQIADFRETFTASTRNEIQVLGTAMQAAFQLQNQQLEAFRNLLSEMTRSNEQKLEALRSTVENKLASLQQDNNAKLESMRATVEEKLQSTLEKRLGESFKMVSDNLDKVHLAMGGMQKLAEGVGDLKKIMTNVTTRGAWGEVQLAAILEQFLSPQQFDANVATKGEGERVEYCVRLPGRRDNGDCVWLPIDAKFPKEDYERLVSAVEAGSTDLAEQAAKNLEIRVKTNAKDIRDKYLNPPVTTDFAIMFLPTEGLYAEILRRPGLAETLQRDFRVIVAGPTTLVALLNSLQMGFRTLAIEKRSSEVWETLGAVKTEFGKFGAVLENVKKKLHSASREIDGVGQRTRAMERKLRNVTAAEEDQVQELLGPEIPLELPEESTD